MNISTSTRRVYTDAEKAVYHRIRLELAFWTAEHRRYKGVNVFTAFRICMLHKVLNTLRGRADCHVLRINKRGYVDAQVCVAAARYLADAQLDVHQPLRCYVLVSTNALKPGVSATKAQLHVQAAHALCELMKGYGAHPDVTRWADVDQTLIVCQLTGWQLPRADLGVYCPHGTQWPNRQFVDSHYEAALAHALYPMTERQAGVLGMSAHQLL